jgi:hypothetical protein
MDARNRHERCWVGCSKCSAPDAAPSANKRGYGSRFVRGSTYLPAQRVPSRYDRLILAQSSAASCCEGGARQNGGSQFHPPAWSTFSCTPENATHPRNGRLLRRRTATGNPIITVATTNYGNASDATCRLMILPE